MAKRKRLTPARPGFLDGPLPGEAMRAPIADMAGSAATEAALSELTAVMETARARGLMLEDLPLEAIADRHLVRDRMGLDTDEMAALMASLRARGQQTPIEVVALKTPVAGCSHGLISGWRRLSALRRLHAETGADRFATVRARVVTPESAEAAYVAMVEENEIRVNLSHYERARIAERAVAEGVFPDLRAALQGLYGAVTRSKRSKIGTFVGLVTALDPVLRFPTAISEKLGLALARVVEARPDIVSNLRDRLTSRPASSAEEELAILAEAVRQADLAPGTRTGVRTGVRTGTQTGAAPSSGPSLAPSSDGADLTRYDIARGLVVRHWPGRVEISGEQVDARLLADLKAWLEAR